MNFAGHTFGILVLARLGCLSRLVREPRNIWCASPQYQSLGRGRDVQRFMAHAIPVEVICHCAWNNMSILYAPANNDHWNDAQEDI